MKITLSSIICVILFAVGACGKDISTQFENYFGRSTRLQTEKALEEALKVLYRWQDQVEFNRQEVKRDVARFGVEFMENLNQIERLNQKFESRIKQVRRDEIYEEISEESANKKVNKLKERRKQFFSTLMQNMYNSTGLIQNQGTQLLTDNHDYYNDVLETKSRLTTFDGIIGNMSKETLQELSNRAYKLKLLNEDIKRTLKSKNSKSKQLEDLEAGLVDMEIASVATLAGGPIAWIIGAVTKAKKSAQRATLTTELRHLTEKYFKATQDMTNLLQKRDTIAIDQETADHFLERLHLVSKALVNTEKAWDNNLNEWQEVLIAIGQLETAMTIFHRANELKNTRFFKGQVNSGRELYAKAEKHLNALIL